MFSVKCKLPVFKNTAITYKDSVYAYTYANLEFTKQQRARKHTLTFTQIFNFSSAVYSISI